MDLTDILKLLDEERRTGADGTATLEISPHVVRYLSTNWRGIFYSHFSAADTDRIIDEELERFSHLGGTFEWKIYSHDEPRELPAILAARGFKQGPEEALMIATLEGLPESLFHPVPEQISVKEIADESLIDDVFAIEAAVWKSSHRNRDEMVAMILDPLKRDVGFVAYFEEKPAGFARVTCSAESRFAGLWGGSVIEEFRGHGVYRALLATRIAFARERPSVRFLRVDALPTSRPILEKYGFVKASTTWPFEWMFNQEDGSDSTPSAP
jgi:GNAT superfamily N-acetyltransferase